MTATTRGLWCTMRAELQEEIKHRWTVTDGRHIIWEQEVAGSIPATPTSFDFDR